ncbi:hypothetical protein QTO34_016051, partial [Cnephaeus nilssonii]
MYLFVLLACVLWCLESHPIPMKITSGPLYDNHTAVCAEIQKDLSADNTTYNGYFKRPQNTSKESCYGEFIKDFISTLKNLMKDNKNEHLQKVYENMKHLTQICTKLQPKRSPKNCTSEYSDFTQFKEALKSVILYIEVWKSWLSVATKGQPWGVAPGTWTRWGAHKDQGISKPLASFRPDFKAPNGRGLEACMYILVISLLCLGQQDVHEPSLPLACCVTLD